MGLFTLIARGVSSLIPGGREGRMDLFSALFGTVLVITYPTVSLFRVTVIGWMTGCKYVTAAQVISCKLGLRNALHVTHLTVKHL
jgi:hypothetical protein